MPTTYWAFPAQTFTAWDKNGDPVPGAKANISEAGTSTPLTTYTDTALTTPHAVPQIADANGVFAPMYISGADEIKIDVTDADDVQLPGYPVDNITGIPVGGLTASGVVFDPTATLASVTVQAALEALDTLTDTTLQPLDDTLVSIAAVAGVAGDILYASGTDAWERLEKGANGEILTLASGIPSWAADKFSGDLFHVRDEKASGTAGGTFTKDIWQKRDLNTVLTNEISGASVSSSVITLLVGTYYIEARAPAFKAVTLHKAKLRNTTDSTDTLIGTSEKTQNTDDVQSVSFVSGRFTIDGTKNLELQHQSSATQATDGFGAASSFSVVEVYTEVRIWKVS